MLQRLLMAASRLWHRFGQIRTKTQLRQDRPHGAKCLTNVRLRLIFCTGTKPTKLLGFVLIQNPIADSGTLTKFDADRL